MPHVNVIFRKILGDERYEAAEKFMTELAADPNLPRVYRVEYREEYIGVVVGTRESALAEAMDMVRSLQRFVKRPIVPDDLYLDDSFAWNYQHFTKAATGD